MTENAQELAVMAARLEYLTDAINNMARAMGTRLTTEDMCHRYGVHRNTLAKWAKEERGFPQQYRDRKWILSEVMEWERKKSLY